MTTSIATGIANVHFLDMATQTTMRDDADPSGQKANEQIMQMARIYFAVETITIKRNQIAPRAQLIKKRLWILTVAHIYTYLVSRNNKIAYNNSNRIL